MAQLEYNTNQSVIEFAIEIKILLLEKNIKMAAMAESKFSQLSAQHAVTAAKYEAALASIGLSPAREDEIHLIEEMEAVAARKNKAKKLASFDIAKDTLEVCKYCSFSSFLLFLLLHDA